MAFSYTYEQQLFAEGWFDDSCKVLPSWFDDDIASLNGAVIQLDFVTPDFFDDPDVVYGPLPPLEIIIFPDLFLDEDMFFVPFGARALDAPDKVLKNEIIRVR